jgi:hypothetical protein
VEHFRARNLVRRTRHLIETSGVDRQLVTVEDMQRVVRSQDLYGIQRFCRDVDDPTRSYARKLLQH